jgi:hypothetical protein
VYKRERLWIIGLTSDYRPHLVGHRSNQFSQSSSDDSPLLLTFFLVYDSTKNFFAPPMIRHRHLDPFVINSARFVPA